MKMPSFCICNPCRLSKPYQFINSQKSNYFRAKTHHPYHTVNKRIIRSWRFHLTLCHKNVGDLNMCHNVKINLIWTKFVDPSPTMQHTKVQGHWSFGSWEGFYEDFYLMWTWQPFCRVSYTTNSFNVVSSNVTMLKSKTHNIFSSIVLVKLPKDKSW